jgi:hypothetical protein
MGLWYASLQGSPEAALFFGKLVSRRSTPTALSVDAVIPRGVPMT